MLVRIGKKNVKQMQNVVLEREKGRKSEIDR